MHFALVLIFRWLHIASACLAVGSVFFMRLIVPRALSGLEPEARQAVFLKMRRGLKMVIHSAILFFLISGIYNTCANWTAYREAGAPAHAMWGVHVLLALCIFAIALYVLMGQEPPKTHGRWTAINLLLMALAIAAAAGVKYFRDNRPRPNADINPRLPS